MKKQITIVSIATLAAWVFAAGSSRADVITVLTVAGPLGPNAAVSFDQSQFENGGDALTISFSEQSGSDVIFQVNQGANSDSQKTFLWIRNDSTWYRSPTSFFNNGLKVYTYDAFAGTFDEYSGFDGSSVNDSNLGLDAFDNVTGIGITTRNDGGPNDYTNLIVNATAIPEPASLMLLGLGGLCLLGGRRRAS